MSGLARLRGLTLSVLIHVGAVAAIVAWSAADWARPLFVDLLERAEPSAVAGGGAPTAPAAQPARRAPASAARAGATAPGPSAAPRPLAPPSEPPAPAPPPVAMSVAPPVASSPAPAAPAVEPAPLPAPAVPAPASSNPPTPGVASSVNAPSVTGRGGEPGTGGRTSGETRGDAGSAPAGSPGAPLALAAPGSGVPAEYGPYLRRFRQLVHEALIYPLAARRQGLGGIVELDVWLEASGLVRDVRIVRSSSHRLLDDAAVETIRRLGPVPFPDTLPRRSLLIRIPLVFELR